MGRIMRVVPCLLAQVIIWVIVSMQCNALKQRAKLWGYLLSSIQRHRYANA